MIQHVLYDLVRFKRRAGDQGNGVGVERSILCLTQVGAWIAPVVTFLSHKKIHGGIIGSGMHIHIGDWIE